MRKWRIEGWLDGELTGEITAVDTDAPSAAPTQVFEEEPRWSEFWDTGESTGEFESTGTTGEGAPIAPPPPTASVEELAGISAKRLWTWACIVALLGVVARAAWYFNFQDEFAWRLGPDGMTHLNQAVGYMLGGIGNPEAGSLSPAYREFLPPGYPLFLSAIFQPFGSQEAYALGEGPLLAVRIVQWLMAGGLTLMTFALARRVLFGWAALVPAVLVTLSAGLLDLPNLLASETLLAFLLCGSLLLLVKAREIDGRDRGLLVLLAGLAFSYALLTQPRIVLLLPFAAIWLGRNLNVKFGAAFAIVALALPVGWIVRDYVLFDEFVPVSIAGQVAVYTDNVEPVGGSGTVARAAPAECPRTQLLVSPLEYRFNWARCMQAAGVDEIAAHPGDSALAVPDRVAALFSPWNPTRARGNYSVPHADYHYLVPAATRTDSTFRQIDRTLGYVWVAGYIALLIVGLATLLVEGPLSPARLIALPLLTLPLIHLVLHAENRFRLALLPFALIALTLGALTAWDALKPDVARDR